MPSNIIAPRVPFLDVRTGLISREWYQFLLSLFELTGAGTDVSTLTELEADVLALDAEVDGLTVTVGNIEAPVVSGLLEQIAELTKAVQALQEAPPVTPSGVLVLTATATLDFPSTAAGAASDLTMTVPGAVEGDVACLGVPNASTVANGSFSGWVSAPNTVTVRFANNSSSTAYDPASGVFRAVVTRY